jgi:hypothetical protein
MLSSLLADFVVDREWITRSRADQVVRDARDRGHRDDRRPRS